MFIELREIQINQREDMAIYYVREIILEREFSSSKLKALSVLGRQLLDRCDEENGV